MTYLPAVTDAMRTLGVTDLFLTKSGHLREILGSSTKVEKGEGKGVKTKILYLAPHKQAGLGFSVCPHAGRCAGTCLDRTGHLVYARNKAVRVVKTAYWYYHTDRFLDQLDGELELHRRSNLQRFVPAVRLNGTSDIQWERNEIPQKHPRIRFYDFTKFPLGERDVLENYHLTFSVSEKPNSWAYAAEYMAAGFSAAVVVRTQAMAKAVLERGEYLGFPTIDGDENDIRFNDPGGHLVILYAKGKRAQNNKSGFVHDVEGGDNVSRNLDRKVRSRGVRAASQASPD